MKPIAIIAFLLLLVSGQSISAEGNDFALKDGDRVVFYGDSITDQRLYTTFTESYVVTRFPNRNIRFVHSGWGGDRVTGGGGGPIDLRLQRDVFPYKPTVMTIMLGMNDGSYRPFDQAVFETYSKGYEHILDQINKNAPTVRLTLIGPSPYDDVTREIKIKDGYNNVLVRYAAFVKELAGREHAGYADLNAPVVAALQKAKESDPEGAKKIIPDFVHPGNAGHLLMAGALLQAWHAPALVSSVEIDANSKKVAQIDNTKVSQLTVDRNISWTQEDEALPMPMDLADPVINLALKSSDFVQTLDQQSLKVTGLPAGKFSIKIDGKEAGTFSNDELNGGINLAARQTPMLKQAMEVHALTLKHNELHFTRWRQIQTKLDQGLEGLDAALAKLDEVEESLIKQQRHAAKPVAHNFELIAL